MKLSQLPSVCAACGQPLTFPCYRLRLELVVANQAAARRLLGVAEVLGGLSNPGALGVAKALTGDEELATCAGDENPELLFTRFVCVPCACFDRLLGSVLNAERHRLEADGDVV